ncbi:MAG: DEAD/DEAH box helicase [Anaerolineales bacterium]
MSLSTLLNHWRADPSIAPHIASWETVPKRSPVFVSPPDILHPALRSSLEERRIHKLYKHQHLAWDAAQNGKNVAVVTGTASGKTLAYTLPVVDDLLKNEQRRALFLFPTKALARDQLNALKASFPLSTAPYDGDTPQNHRKQIRQNARLILSNPDMLHLGILPHHTNWELFFSHLGYVVIDEMHIYRGVFGSHVANVIRRLKRVAAHYGSQPQFLLTSATIGNPQELAEALTEEPVTVIDEDFSARGERHFLIYNPPVIDETLGLRAGMQNESVRLVSDLFSYDIQTILFGRSRRSVEFMLAQLKGKISPTENVLRAYRSGYLPAQRREIEKGLREGEVRVVTATTALELGIDIGGMGAAVLAGYPGTIAGTWQQAGRAGRTEKPSLSILVVSSNPLDQFLAHHPAYFFERSPEHALLDPDNLLILLKHIQCAAFELPFREGEKYGDLSLSQTLEFLDFLQKQGALYLSQNTYYWMDKGYPASEISLRATSSDQITLIHTDLHGTQETIGTVDMDSAHWMVHPGAIYLHEGEDFKVEDLDLEGNKAYLVDAYGDYYTEPEKQTSVECLTLRGEEDVPGGKIYHGELSVTRQVVGFKKINWQWYEILGREPLHLPSTTLETTGFWLSLSERTIQTLQSSGTWSSGSIDYGPRWPSIRKIVLERDQNKCQACGKRWDQAQLHIHHKQPLRSFRSLQEANQLDNLITLCPRCHQRVENVVRVKSGLSGLSYLLHNLAPLLLMCDSHDLGVHADPASPLGDNLPTVVIHEQIPAGIGFSKRLFERHDELINQAYELVRSCPCLDGCPSCVGPGGELGSGGKSETLAILEELILLT